MESSNAAKQEIKQEVFNAIKHLFDSEIITVDALDNGNLRFKILPEDALKAPFLEQYGKEATTDDDFAEILTLFINQLLEMQHAKETGSTQ